ncbi:MAG: TonB-dependent receptor plug domain-containing protein [Sphingomonas sp.]|uniref:TonB-dependent receptor plug domain-containing protein n=1 Tax=Sphingomonas sp. TaxID=28214 RepID=UPI003F81D71B
MVNFGRLHSRNGRYYAAGLAMTALAIVQASPAFAQSTPAAPQDAQAAPQNDQATSDPTKGDIVITGSRIVRSGFQTPQPLTVISQKEIETQSPTNNLADFVNTLPALAGSTKPANSRLNLSSGQAGINALNLRNLDNSSTGTRTLVLIDGRRSVGSTVNDIVDINTIPQGLVKSVEIVTGGASAAYGSDAVAGVVNFILDKKYEGLKVSADSGVTTYGDGGNYSASLTAGTGFAGGRGHILFNAEVAHQDGIFSVDRAWNATGYVSIPNPAWVAGDATAPRNLTTLRQVGAANSTPGGLITGNAPVGGLTPAQTAAFTNNLRGIYFGQGGSVNHFNFGTYTYPAITGSSGPSLTQGGDWQVNDSGRRIGLMPADNRYGFFGRLSYDVADNVEIFAEASYNREKSVFNAGPNLSTGITYQADNAYLIQELGLAALTNVKTVTVATTAADLPYRGVNNERKVQRYVIGADGQFQAFGKAAHWDIYAQYGRADMREQLTNIMNTQNMLNATDAVFAPAGNALGVPAGTIVCRSTLTNPTNGCIPLNRLGIGVANPAAFAYVLGNPERDEIAEQKVAGANLSLTPFRTWAGDVSVAVGGEWREESIKGFVPQKYQPIINRDANGVATSTTNLWSVGNYLPTNGRYNVKEAYLETVVPLGLGLEFNGAARATDYSTSGYVTTWKAGLTWQPIRDIRFRVTRSRDIRAPNLSDLYQSGGSNSDSVHNPFYDLDPVHNPQASYGYSATVVGNPNLKPEKSNSWNIGAVITPRFLKGFNASIDYFRIEIKDAIGSFGAQDIINLCSRGNQDFCAAYTVDPNNTQRLLFRTQPFNFARQLVRGIDFEAAYRVPLGSVSAFTLRGTATEYLDNLLYTGIQGAVTTNTAGVNGGQGSTPRWIFHFSGTLDLPTTSITAVARGVSSGKYSASGIECTSGCPVYSSAAPTYDNNHVSGLFYVDLNLTQNIKINSKSDAQFFVNVTNVFNRWPLLVPETGLAANTTYSDMLGRTFRAGVRIKLR